MSDEIQFPSGFQAAGVACGIKESGKPDVAIFASDRPATGVGVFTQNQVVGAPVIVSRSRTPGETLQAVVINSGNSNACTGDRGIADARQMTVVAGEELGIDSEAILVCSTGVIGHFLPMETVSQGIRSACGRLGNSAESLEHAARAIMTTDTFPKISCRCIEIDGKSVTVAGVAKGAAMIAPNMATMLSVIMTDYEMTPTPAGALLKDAVDKTFNCISVDGHTSTSDTVLLLANGASGVGHKDDGPHEDFITALSSVCSDLSQQIIRDAEGAEHFVTVEVTGVPSVADARRVAKAVCESPLVKTAITGNDPNWGRIVSAAGYSGFSFLERDLSLYVNEVLIYEFGVPLDFDAPALSSMMQQGEVSIRLEFRLGTASIVYWTCDLTAEYVRLNADYTT